MSVVCCQVERSLRRGDHASRGVIPTVLRRCASSRNLKNEEAIGLRWAAAPHEGKKIIVGGKYS